MVYYLNIWEDYKLTKQKKHSFGLQRQDAIREEIAKLIQAGYMSEVIYQKWLASIVLAKKANGKWSVCVDLNDLNKSLLER